MEPRPRIESPRSAESPLVKFDKIFPGFKKNVVMDRALFHQIRVSLERLSMKEKANRLEVLRRALERQPEGAVVLTLADLSNKRTSSTTDHKSVVAKVENSLPELPDLPEDFGNFLDDEEEETQVISPEEVAQVRAAVKQNSRMKSDGDENSKATQLWPLAKAARTKIRLDDRQVTQLLPARGGRPASRLTSSEEVSPQPFRVIDKGVKTVKLSRAGRGGQRPSAEQQEKASGWKEGFISI